MNSRGQSKGFFDLEALEPRLLLSADPVANLVAADDGFEAESAVVSTLPSEESHETSAADEPETIFGASQKVGEHQRHD